MSARTPASANTRESAAQFSAKRFDPSLYRLAIVGADYFWTKFSFTSQNQHDCHDVFVGPVDMGSFDKPVSNALGPGGLFVVIDHLAPAGSGISDAGTLRRMDPDAVKQGVEAAGIGFDGGSDALTNPADPPTGAVFDQSLRGHTDPFILSLLEPVDRTSAEPLPAAEAAGNRWSYFSSRFQVPSHPAGAGFASNARMRLSISLDGPSRAASCRQDSKAVFAFSQSLRRYASSPFS